MADPSQPILLFEWDAQNLDHIARHGIGPREAEQVISGPAIILKEEFRDGEFRTSQLGEPTPVKSSLLSPPCERIENPSSDGALGQEDSA